MKFIHTNIIASDWRKLADFYIKVFGCKEVYPKRDLRGEWIDRGTGIRDVHVEGVHLILPGYNEDGPTLEIFQYNKSISQDIKNINREHQQNNTKDYFHSNNSFKGSRIFFTFNLSHIKFTK